MEAFLKQTVDKVISEHDNLEYITIVLPSQRACTYFKHYLRNNVNNTSWLPKIITIDSFFKQNSNLKPVDGIELLIEFYNSYLSIEKKEAEVFDTFIKWASTLLADFNEIDHYLAEPKIIFQDLSNIKNIDNWSFNTDDLTEIQTNFSSFWNKLHAYYLTLNQQLKKQNKAYSGAIYKDVANKAFEIIDNYKENSVYFIGFNALSASEKLLIQTFVSSKKGSFIFDGDEFYINNQNHEAGHFIRKNKGEDFIRKNKIGNYFKESAKSITCIAAQSSIIQAKIAGELLSQINKEELSQTALVLADESLLIPALNSIPKSIDNFNVSMGYSLENTPIFELINSVFTLQENYKKFGQRIYYTSLFKIINNYLLKVKSTKAKDEIVKRNLLFIYPKFIQEQTEFTPILFLFKEWNSDSLFTDVKTCLYQLINYIKTTIKVDKDSLELEYLFATQKLVAKIDRQLGDQNYIKDIKTLKHLFLQLFKQESVAFIGEPLNDLQIIGMLETRALDFKNIIITSVNEGVLPKAENSSSFIPYELKRLYKLPTYKEKEAIYANHFYRFLQRAENIYLIYNEAVSGIAANEKSRYINQLEEELPAYNDKITLKKLTSEIQVYPNINNELIFDSNEVIIAKLNSLNESGFSPTSLRTFINCKQDFYYKYIIGLKDEEDVDETIEANTLGSIIHKVLEDLYEPFIGKFLTEKDILTMLSTFEEYLKTEFKEQYSSDFETGKNYLFYNAAKKTIKTYLNQEKKLVKKHNIKIIALEQKLKKTISLNINGTQKEINIKGTIDRVDLFDNELRIIDYKTGKVSPQDLGITNIEGCIEKAAKEKAFQLMIYLLLAKEEYSQYSNITLGIISFKSLSAGLLELKIKNSSPIEEADAFIEQLEFLMNSIFSKDVAFEHNKKSKYCKYC
jgi:ATP-dependent helicase/nuclease subunit B